MDLTKAKQLAQEAAEDNPQLREAAAPIIPPMVPGRTCHVDADYLCYFAAGGDEMPAGMARQVAKERIEKFRLMTGSEFVIAHLSARDCDKGGRFFIAAETPYQGQRTGRKPKNWSVVREYLEEYTGSLFKVKVWKTREADDGAAYCCETLAGGEDACASRDKDWRMFAALHCDWLTYQLTKVNPGDFHVLGPEPPKGEDQKHYGHYFFWFQMLAGDTADHIPGLFGTGKGDAHKLLAWCNSNADAFSVVVSQYRHDRPDDWADYFVEQAALLWMRVGRHAEIRDFVSIIPDGNEWVDAALLRLEERVAQDRADLEAILNARKNREASM